MNGALIGRGGCAGARGALAVALGACAAALSAPEPGSARAHAGEPPHFLAPAEPRPLMLDPTRLAVFDANRADGAQRTLDALRAAGVEALAADPWPIAGWTLVTVPPGLGRDVPAARRLVAHAAQRAAGAFVAPVFFDDLGGPMWPTPWLLVQAQPGVASRDLETIVLALAPGEIVDRDWAGMEGALRVRLDSRDGFGAIDAANALASRPEILYAEPDMVFTGRGAVMPTDPYFADQWGLHNTGDLFGLADFDVDAPDAWNISAGGAGVIIGIIDTGVDTAHPDLSLASGTDVTDSPTPGGRPGNSFDNHGTPVAGCATARFNNGLGVAGVAPLCRSASIRTFIGINSFGGWTSQASWTVDALEWARTHGVRITNNSNGYGFTSSAIATKYNSTRNAGITHFASAMNDGEPALGYPASLVSVNAVGAADRHGERASFSNFGEGLDFMAPGVAVWTTDRLGAAGYESGDYRQANGTSFASPHAAGVAALLLAANPSLFPWEVEDALAASCEEMGPAGYDTDYGWGMINARRALELVAPGLGDCPGDLNGDAQVDTADLGVLLDDFGGAGFAGDINGDGVVNTADLGLLLNGFAVGCP